MKITRERSHRTEKYPTAHGVGYNFELFSIIILDDLHQGFPCAMMTSNCKDTEVLECFYHTIKNIVENIKPKEFTTDMATKLYNAWETAMGRVELWLFCAWHVDKA